LSYRLPSGSLFNMKEKFKAYFTSEVFYTLLKKIGDTLVDMTEPLLKQWLGTVVGQRWLKWFTDIIVTRFMDQIVRVIMRVGAVRAGYIFDDSRADRIVIRLQTAEENNDEDLYMRTLNDALRSNKLPKP